MNEEQEAIDINFSYVKSDNGNSSFSHGAKEVSFNNIGILDILSEMSQIPLEHFALDGNAHNNLANLKIISEKELSKEDALNAFVSYIDNHYKIEVTFPIRNIESYVASIIGESKFEQCNDSIQYNKITLINRTWIGECISSDIFIKQINEWYNINVVNEIKLNKLLPKRFNLTLQKANSAEELFLELNEYFNIDIQRKKRDIKTIKVDFKL